MGTTQKSIVDLLKYPLLTDKAVKLLEKDQYSFIVEAAADKNTIKTAIEQFFCVSVRSVNTCILPAKKHRKKSGVKKAIVRLVPGDRIAIYE
jgi:large subunit ribosomal protein L23